MANLQNYQRKIIHIDMDCFYAAIEMRDDPSLVGKPVAVGGDVYQHGVLTTCNYEARKFGLHSAMPTAQALKRCPNLILRPVNMAYYKSVSAQIHQIFRRYTDIIEPLSLDEAFLDVTDSAHFSGSATWIAEAIRQAIAQELKLTASAGVAPLKFLAKIASDQNKPNGIFDIPPEKVADFIHQLPLKKIPGVGKVTQEKLTQLGLQTCADIQQSDQALIYKNFGKFGQRLWAFSHGIDNRSIEPNRPRKSVAVENTLITPIDNLDEAKNIVSQQFESLKQRLNRNCKDIPLSEFKKLGIKLKFDDFSQTTLERTMNGLTLARFLTLLEQIWERRAKRKIRLIGLNVHLPNKKITHQLNLWE